MYRLTLVMLFGLFCLACNKKDHSDNDCSSKICTENFASLHFNFTKKDGTGVAVENYSAINQRTGDTLKSSSAAYMDLTPGTYIVVDDSHLKKLSDTGDDIKITGTYPVTNQTKSAMIKVSGGPCACHIDKLSGPDKIVFD